MGKLAIFDANQFRQAGGEDGRIPAAILGKLASFDASQFRQAGGEDGQTLAAILGKLAIFDANGAHRIGALSTPNSAIASAAIAIIAESLASKSLRNSWSALMLRWVIALGVLAAVVGIGGAGYGVWTIWNQHRLITSARPVRAKVVGHQTRDLKASGFVAKVPLVKYEYTVDQKPYTCETVTPVELMLPDAWAESVFKQFPVGARREAQYDPRDPSQAFLIAKYSVKPYLPLLVSLVIAALGLGVVADQLMDREAPTMTPTRSGAIALGARQHHLARARVLGVIGVVGLICGAPAILHHLMVSTSPHERMGFLLEGGYGIAVLTVLARSAMQFRQGYGFGTPVVTIDRPPAVGQPLQLTVSAPTRFRGTVDLNARVKCVAKDTRLFNFSEETPDTTILEQDCLSAKSRTATKDGEITQTAELIIPAQMPPSTPVDSVEKTHIVWSLILTAEGSGGRKAETEYILSVKASET